MIGITVDARGDRGLIRELAALAKAHPGESEIRVTLATSLGPMILELGPRVDRAQFVESFATWFAGEPAMRLDP